MTVKCPHDGIPCPRKPRCEVGTCAFFALTGRWGPMSDSERAESIMLTYGISAKNNPEKDELS